MHGCDPDPISRQRIFRRVAMCATLIGILLAPSLSQAVEYTAARKAGRGLAAMTTSFLEVPGNMVAETRERGAAAGVPLGFVFGLGKIVVRTLVGVYEFVSSPFEAPAGFEPIIEPEFPWSYLSRALEQELIRSDERIPCEPLEP
jgi:putative exosortase-associated protein (TIGR04073 family)